MSQENSNTRTTPATDTIDSVSHLHVVADAPRQQNAPTTEDKVREALTDNPGATTAALATAAGVGRSTAAKILARWGLDGSAIRTAGDGPRHPDTWTSSPSGHDTDTPGTVDTRPDTTASDTTDHTATANEPGPDGAITTAVQEAATGPAADDAPEATATDTNDETGSATASAVETSPLPDTTLGAPGDNATGTGPSAAESPADTDTVAKNRLPKGGLRALVEEYLTEHPGENFGPAKIGKDLGRSGGAVNNALEKLVGDRYVIKTCEAPKRFAINPDKTDVSATSDNTEPAVDA
ncbi:hypothetical protein [Amycolatopsis speibonae]|uniref:MarR family transcriptional regulator n=1 Tax=Amycolatopsis speibonae TaxID=1450224 RepID=A0ABV7NZ55_9PSEU